MDPDENPYRHTFAPPEDFRPGRSRARDWWRWLTLIPGLGGLISGIALLVKGRPAWGSVILLSSLGSTFLFFDGGRLLQNSGYSTSSGYAYGNFPEYQQGQNLAVYGLGLLVLVIILGWCVPNTGRRPSRRPWPEVTARAKQLTATYGVVAYAIAFGVVVGLNYILKAAGAHLGIGPGVLIVDAILFAGLAPLLLAGKLGAKDLGLRPTKAGASTGLAILAFIAYVALVAVYSLVFIHASNTTGTVNQNYNIFAGPSTFTVYLDCFAMAIAAPVTEEIFFRGLLYRSLRNKMGIWPAALIAGCLFGLVHITGYPLITLPIKAIFGVLMCLLYERTRSLLPTIAVHAMVDGSAADYIFTGNLDVAGIVLGVVLIAVLLRVIYNAFQDRRSINPQTYDAPGFTIGPALSGPVIAESTPPPAAPAPPDPYTKGRMPW